MGISTISTGPWLQVRLVRQSYADSGIRHGSKLEIATEDPRKDPTEILQGYGNFESLEML